MATFNCKMCGGTLHVESNATTAVCEYCGTTNTLPIVNEDRIAKLFDRANERRRNSEFDDAMSIYENIIAEDSAIAEAYWGIVLCRFGIEYVKDPQTFEMKPTCHRTILSSIFSDEEYKKALQYADAASKAIYEKEAEAIDRIQKKIIEISSKEKPYDVFICYKENEDGLGRTEDSSIAQDICTYLTNDGLKVFFARITLRAMAGAAYEPYIFAALNTAKVMIVIGTKTEYFNAPWVRNEWSRFLAMMKNNQNKVLIPCYKNIAPTELPPAFVHAEALNISTGTFMLDLIRSIRKVIPKKEKQTAQTVIQGVAGNAQSLRKRGQLFLVDREFGQAEEYLGRSLDMDPECAETYWLLLLAKRKCANESELIDKGKRFNNMTEYRNVMRFASGEEKKKVEDVEQAIEDKISAHADSLKQLARQKITDAGFYKIVDNSKSIYEKEMAKTRQLLEEFQEIEDSIREYIQICKEIVMNGPLKEMEKCKESAMEIALKLDHSYEIIKAKDMDNMKIEIQRLLENTIYQEGNIKNEIENNSNFRQLKELRDKKADVLAQLQNSREKIENQIAAADRALEQSYHIWESYKPVWEAVQRGEDIQTGAEK